MIHTPITLDRKSLTRIGPCEASYGEEEQNENDREHAVKLIVTERVIPEHLPTQLFEGSSARAFQPRSCTRWATFRPRPNMFTKPMAVRPGMEGQEEEQRGRRDGTK